MTTMGKPMTDATFDPAELDPGIRETVLWLRRCGFKTTDSGDGKTKFSLGFTEDDGIIPRPHVAMTVPPYRLAKEANRLRDALLGSVHVIRLDDSDEDAPRIEATYSPCTGMAMILLLNVHDGMLKRGDA